MLGHVRSKRRITLSSLKKRELLSYRLSHYLKHCLLCFPCWPWRETRGDPLLFMKMRMALTFRKGETGGLVLKRKEWPLRSKENKMRAAFFSQRRNGWPCSKEERVAIIIWREQNGFSFIRDKRIAIYLLRRRGWPSPLHWEESGSLIPKENKVALC